MNVMENYNDKLVKITVGHKKYLKEHYTRYKEKNDI